MDIPKDTIVSLELLANQIAMLSEENAIHDKIIRQLGYRLSLRKYPNLERKRQIETRLNKLQTEYKSLAKQVSLHKQRKAFQEVSGQFRKRISQTSINSRTSAENETQTTTEFLNQLRPANEQTDKEVTSLQPISTHLSKRLSQLSINSGVYLPLEIGINSLPGFVQLVSIYFPATQVLQLDRPETVTDFLAKINACYETLLSHEEELFAIDRKAVAELSELYANKLYYFFWAIDQEKLTRFYQRYYTEEFRNLLKVVSTYVAQLQNELENLEGDKAATDAAMLKLAVARNLLFKLEKFYNTIGYVAHQRLKLGYISFDFPVIDIQGPVTNDTDIDPRLKLVLDEHNANMQANIGGIEAIKNMAASLTETEQGLSVLDRNIQIATTRNNHLALSSTLSDSYNHFKVAQDISRCLPDNHLRINDAKLISLHDRFKQKISLAYYWVNVFTEDSANLLENLLSERLLNDQDVLSLDDQYHAINNVLLRAKAMQRFINEIATLPEQATSVKKVAEEIEFAELRFKSNQAQLCVNIATKLFTYADTLDEVSQRLLKISVIRKIGYYKDIARTSFEENNRGSVANFYHSVESNVILERKINALAIKFDSELERLSFPLATAAKNTLVKFVNEQEKHAHQAYETRKREYYAILTDEYRLLNRLEAKLKRNGLTLDPGAQERKQLINHLLTKIIYTNFDKNELSKIFGIKNPSLFVPMSHFPEKWLDKLVKRPNIFKRIWEFLRGKSKKDQRLLGILRLGLANVVSTKPDYQVILSNIKELYNKIRYRNSVVNSDVNQEGSAESEIQNFIQQLNHFFWNIKIENLERFCQSETLLKMQTAINSFIASPYTFAIDKFNLEDRKKSTYEAVINEHLLLLKNTITAITTQAQKVLQQRTGRDVALKEIELTELEKQSFANQLFKYIEPAVSHEAEHRCDVIISQVIRIEPSGLPNPA